MEKGFTDELQRLRPGRCQFCLEQWFVAQTPTQAAAVTGGQYTCDRCKRDQKRIKSLSSANDMDPRYFLPVWSSDPLAKKKKKHFVLLLLRWGNLLRGFVIRHCYPRQTKFSRCFDVSPGWDRSSPTVSALTILDSMAPAFVIKLLSRRFAMLPCHFAQVKTCRNRCEFKSGIQTKIKAVVNRKYPRIPVFRQFR